MKTIKGYIMRTGGIARTPAMRLAYFRHEGAIKSGQYWTSARECMHAPEVSVLSSGFNVRYPGTAYEKRTPIMVCYANEQFRNENWADEYDDTGIDHRGWFSDADCSETYRAFVFNLPHDRFGCGYAMTGTGERVYFLKVFDNRRDAATHADREAQYHAEEEQEFNRRWHAAHEVKSEIDELTRQVARLYALRNHATLGDDVRDELRDVLENIRAKRETLATDYKDIAQ